MPKTAKVLADLVRSKVVISIRRYQHLISAPDALHTATRRSPFHGWLKGVWQSRNRVIPQPIIRSTQEGYSLACELEDDDRLLQSKAYFTFSAALRSRLVDENVPQGIVYFPTIIKLPRTSHPNYKEGNLSRVNHGGLVVSPTVQIVWSLR